MAEHQTEQEAIAWRGAFRPCECVGFTIRTDYGTGIEHDVDTSSCPIHTAETDRIARVLMDAWEKAEGAPVNVSYVATFADMARAIVADRGEETIEHEYRVNRSGRGNNIVRDGMTLPQAQAWLRTDLDLGYGPLVHIEQRERRIGAWSDWTDLPSGGDPIPPFSGRPCSPGTPRGGDGAACVCGTLTDLGGPGAHHDDWCPLYRVTSPGVTEGGEGS